MEVDPDDLDILASLADSDFEFQDDDDLKEEITSVKTSPKSELMAATGSQSSSHEQTQQKGQEHDGEPSGTAPSPTVEQMAAQIATMQEYIKKLEAERGLQQETSPKDSKLSDSEQEHQQPTRTLTQLPKNVTSKQNSNKKSLFSKDKERIAHMPSQSQSSHPESSNSSQSSTKRKSFEKSVNAEPGSLNVVGGLGSRQHQKITGGDLASSAKTGREELVTSKRPVTEDDKFLSEKYSGLRIVNPLISSVVMERRMEGRKMVKISQISTKIKGKDDIDGDWVTIGVVVQKLPPKKSSNGKTYGIWKLSDLGANSTNELVALFLFGDVYKEHWKTTEGSVVALLNATLLPAKEKNSKDLALTLDNAKKLMLMGTSKDFGRCREVRKSDNRPCGNYVNRQHGEFCEYHVQTAYKKMRAQRMECQAGHAPSAKAPLMKKFQKDLNNSTFMYQGRTVTASTCATEHKKKNVTLKSLGIGNKNAIDAAGNSNNKQGQKNSAQQSEFLVELLTLPTVGTRNLVKHLNHDEEQKKPPEERQPAMSASDLLKAHEKKIKHHKRSQSVSARLSPLQNSAQNTPMLGRGVDQGSDIFFAESPNIRKRKPSNMDRAKLRALSLVKQNGPIQKEDSNAVRKKLSPKAIEEIEKKARENRGKENDGENQNQDSRKKRRRILGPEFGSINLDSEEGKKLLEAKSQHVGAVREAEAEREEKYFNELEKKEQLEDKMKTITEIKVRVVSCKQCDYVAESASELCYKENHRLTHSKTLKKFFVCKDCKQRTVTYGAPIPKHPCRNCGSSNYQKTSLYKEKEGPKIGGETLLVRGEEVPKFLNSLK